MNVEMKVMNEKNTKTNLLKGFWSICRSLLPRTAHITRDNTKTSRLSKFMLLGLR